MLLLPLLILILAKGANTVFYCKCVIFNSTGAFYSPNYPDPLEDIDCLFYHFIAPSQQIVQIAFSVFQLPPRRSGVCSAIDGNIPETKTKLQHKDEEKFRQCSSSLRFFDHSSDGLIEFDERPSFEFCEKEIEIGHSYYSRDNHFLLQIRNAQESSRGFVGEYTFIPKANFTSDAVELSEFSYRIEKTKGTLYTPDYPYFYPSNINCTYIFPQRRGFTLILSSVDFDLGEKTVLDVFENTNGLVKLQTFNTESHSMFINSAAPIVMHFRAGKNNAKRGRGAVIEFAYEPSTWRASPLHLLNRKLSVIRNWALAFFCGYLAFMLAPILLILGVFTGAATECSHTITSKDRKEGNYSSKQLSNRGSSNLPSKCRVIFEGFPNERVTIKFTYFNLFVPDRRNITGRCADVDNLAADVRVGSRLSRINAWCGEQLPPQLMSSANVMQLEYVTKSSRALRESSPVDHGFRLEYKFHTDWNMGHMQAKVDKNKACRFIFNASVRTSGKLWSVNYPGLYPRNLYCEYIFHGFADQIVHIHFEYFDVEGFNQCDESTQSDFALFSNYQTHDRTNRRFCGKVPPRSPIPSESNYFRMIFSTNDIFDATGFYAHYQFLAPQKPLISRVKLTPSSSNAVSLLSLITLLICYHY